MDSAENATVIIGIVSLFLSVIIACYVPDYVATTKYVTVRERNNTGCECITLFLIFSCLTIVIFPYVLNAVDKLYNSLKEITSF